MPEKKISIEDIIEGLREVRIVIGNSWEYVFGSEEEDRKHIEALEQAEMLLKQDHI